MVFLVAASSTACADVNEETAKIVADLLIADLHFHPHSATSAQAAQELMDANGVLWAGAGAVGRPDDSDRSIWRPYARRLKGRFIAFAGQQYLQSVFREHGEQGMEDPDNGRFKKLLRDAEKWLEAGEIKGIGEIFLNNMNSAPSRQMRRITSATSPTVRAMYNLVARHNAFHTIHMESSVNSIIELEELLASDRRGRILWNHCGTLNGAELVRELLERHPNLFCELSVRYPPVNLRYSPAKKRPSHDIFTEEGPIGTWAEVIEQFPDRFMIGTDTTNRGEYAEAIRTARLGLLRHLAPETARLVAHGTAQRLFGLV